MKKIILLISLLVTNVAFADGFNSEKEARKFSDTFIAGIVKKEFNKSFNVAKKYWPLPEVEVDGLINQIEQQWPIVDKRFGQAIGSEFIKEKRIGKSFLRYYYLHKFQNHAIYWQVSFYKPKNQWIINEITFLDSLESLYE